MNLTVRYVYVLALIFAFRAEALAADTYAVFGKPFRGNFPLGSWHDHNSPKEFIDTNGVIVNSEGQTTHVSIDGHEGYDWLMPEGTPLYAVTDGTIVFSGLEDPTYCPLLNATVAGNFVRIQTTIAGEVFYIDYAHFSTISVALGATVQKGQLLGYSGNTGCSTAPHLHFAVSRSNSNGDLPSRVDPYGWNGSGTDPWSVHPEGAESVYMWEKNAAPERFFEGSAKANDCEGCSAPVAITKVRWMGPNDRKNPNNEFVELFVDRRFAGRSYDLSGFRLKNNRGSVFTISKSLTLSSGKRFKIYSGSGAATKNRAYLKNKKGIWSDDGDCVHLFDSKGRLIYYFYTSTFNCRYVKQ